MDNFLMFWKEVLWGFLMKGVSTILKRDDGGNSVGATLWACELNSGQDAGSTS